MKKFPGESLKVTPLVRCMAVVESRSLVSQNVSLYHVRGSFNHPSTLENHQMIFKNGGGPQLWNHAVMASQQALPVVLMALSYLDNFETSETQQFFGNSVEQFRRKFPLSSPNSPSLSASKLGWFSFSHGNQSRRQGLKAKFMMVNKKPHLFPCRFGMCC